ncbi:MAG: nucleotidyltransferase family protein [candidate division WOR-3 bacterium]|nr:nucleotidyltransferase family protein [candidate division WOR-3 bacterium]
MTSPRPAAELLLGCLSDRGPGTGDRGSGTADWDEVVDVAVREHVAPLLFKRLKGSDARDSVPADAWKRLRRAYFTSGDRNMRLNRELRAVLQCLRSSGVKVIVLKGAYLAEAVYGDVALRPMCDNDLMVPQAELARAEAVLLDMGGVRRKQPGHAAPAPGAQCEDIEPGRRVAKHALPVFIRDLAVELHWTIANPPGPVRVDAAGLWDRARPAAIAGVEVLALSSGDLLLHLCLHFCYQHRLAGLRSFCDIAETINHFRGEMDWAQVVHSAREWRASRYVGLTLHLARSMLGAGVPDDVLEQLVPGGLDQRILETARESVLAQTGYSQGVSLFDLQGAHSLGDKVRLSWKRVFLSRDEMAAIYPASRNSRHLYLYYALRLRDVIRTFGSHTLKRGRLMVRSRGVDPNASLVNWLKEDR